MHRLPLAALALALCSLAGAGCGQGAKRPVGLSSLAIAPASVTPAVGKTQALSGSGLLDDGTTIPIADGTLWISSAEAVATVNGSGLVTAKAPGSAIVSLAARGKTAAVVVTVESSAPQLTSVALTPGASQLEVGGTVQLQLIGTYDAGPTKD